MCRALKSFFKVVRFKVLRGVESVNDAGARARPRVFDPGSMPKSGRGSDFNNLMEDVRSRIIGNDCLI